MSTHPNKNDFFSALLPHITKKLEKSARKYDKPLIWLRLEWVTSVQETNWKVFKNDLKRYKRNYFRSGIAFEGKREPWLLLTEMELNANSCLYVNNQTAHAGINQKNLEIYIKARHGSSQIPDFKDSLSLLVFNTAGIFLDGSIRETTDQNDTHQDRSQHECVILETKPRFKGHREMLPLSSNNTPEIIEKSTVYLSKLVQPTGKYIYGYFPCFNRSIKTYKKPLHEHSYTGQS